MNNTQLETFVRVVEAGSFNKASEEMFITSTAVIKQVNQLKAELATDYGCEAVITFGYN